MGEVQMEMPRWLGWFRKQEENYYNICSYYNYWKYRMRFLKVILLNSGHVDFTVEVERSLRFSMELSLFFVQLACWPQSETVWRQADKYAGTKIAS